MTAISTLATQITRSVKKLPVPQMQEVLNFIKYLETKEDASVVGYVNERTRKAVQEKKRGKHLTTLKELQTEFTDPDAELVLRPEVERELRDSLLSETRISAEEASEKLGIKYFDPLEFEGAGQLNMTIEEIDNECRKMR